MKITNQIVGLMLVLLSLGSVSARGQAASPAKTKQDPAQKVAASVQPLNAAPDPGERKFQANCSRCHTAPEEISPRIVGTVIRHMRVRASLSAEDEKDILRYLAP